MKNFLLAISNCLQAIRFVLKHNMWWVYIVPILFSMVIVGVIFTFTGKMVSSIADPLVELFLLETPEVAPDPFWDKVMYWIKIAGEYTLFGILYGISYFIFFKIQKYIILIFMAPVIAYVSEKAEEIVMGNTYEFNWGIFIKDIWRGIRIAIKNLVLELILIGLVGLLVSAVAAIFTPLAFIAAPLSAILVFLVSAYYYGYSSFDYLNERKRLTIREGNRLIWDNRLMVMGNGTVFGVLMLIPVLGIILAPVICPVGAVLTAHKLNLYEHKKTANSNELTVS